MTATGQEPRVERREEPAGAEREDDADPGHRGALRRWWRGNRRWVGAFLGIMGLLALQQSFAFAALGPTFLNDDIGAQFYLSKLAAEGRIPLVDFQHGWNAGGWWVGGLLYNLVGGDEAVWVFLWLRVTGVVLAMGAAMLTCWRLRTPPLAMFAVVAGTLVLAIPPHGKYTIPALWLLAALPVGRLDQGWPALAVRVLLAATTWWLHIELAVLLTAGLALFDLLRPGARGWAERLARPAALAAGLLVGALSQVAVYARWGLTALELSDQVLLGQTQTYDRQFGWPFLEPDAFRVLIYPTLLLLPFLPVIWRRVGHPVRMLALLNLALGLIPIRRPGGGHVGAVSVLMVLLYVWLAIDLYRSGHWRFDRGGVLTSRLPQVLLGAAWIGSALVVGFTNPTLLAIVGLIAVCLLGVLISYRWEAPWFSVGAAVVLLTLPLVGATTRAVEAGQGGDPYGQARGIAAVIEEDFVRCSDGTREAWVIPSPLTLYDEMDLVNPTPHYLFHYDFVRHTEDIRARMRTGEIPTIILVYNWPESMAALAPTRDLYYTRCLVQEVPATGNLVQIWSYVGPPGRA